MNSTRMVRGDGYVPIPVTAEYEEHEVLRPEFLLESFPIGNASHMVWFRLASSVSN
jgi:hypothetical protein